MEIKKLASLLTHPQDIVLWALTKVSPLIKKDETFIRWEYYLRMHKRLNLEHPETLNEKLQWLKLNDRHPEYTKLVDKFEVKKIVGNIIGNEYIVPTLGIWDSFDEINFEALPNQFVLKCTHDSGGIVICKDKTNFDKRAARKTINKFMRRNFYYDHREYTYKDVPHRIIAEPYLTDESGWQLKDYKIFCFNGEPGFIEVDYDRYVGHKLNVYDKDWNFIDFYMTSPNDKEIKIEKPEKLDLMLSLAKKLAEDKVFVRVDFYSIRDTIYFGELTFHPGSGMIDFHPKEYDKIVGDMLNINK